jgi:type I restriction-modification system DNA methylase subunit
LNPDKQKKILDYLKKVKTANKELTKKELFKDLLNRLYAGNKSIEKIIDKISVGAETTILNIPREDRIHKGSADTLYNKIIIEFENDLKVTLKHAKTQLAGYLLGEFKSGEGYNFVLIASDFVNWKVFAPDVSCLDRLDELKEDELVLNESATASITLTENNAEDFYYWIDRFLFREEKQRATLKRIEDAFGYQSSVFIECFRELRRNFNDAKKYGEVQVSFDQWEKFLSVAYGSFEASEETFLIHTYLSVFAKMLAYTVVSNDDFIDDEELMGILDGSIFNKYNIRNFVDNDFFYWVKRDRVFRSLKKVFRLIAQELASFDFTEVEEDILKGVYQELIDLDTRHSLGEYYTPDWLCERIVAEYNFRVNHKILDPACGSGSFLRAVVHRLRKLNPKMSVDEINECVHGIDIHPLSVQISKTTLLLSLGKEITSARRPIHLNVILANTLLTPQGVEELMGGEFKIKIDKKTLPLNTKIFEADGLFDHGLDVCESLAESSVGKEIEPIEVFENSLRIAHGESGINKIVIQSFYRIYEALKKVKEEGRNGIWKFILENLYRPYLLSGRFDFVVGNPPWFTYSSIKNEEYQKTLNELAEEYSVKPERIANYPHLEIAAIFLAYCSSYFLKENGKLAFVLPRSFFSADHHDNTRSGKAKGFKIDSVWDLEGVSPLFRIPSCVMFTEKAGHKTKRGILASGVPGILFSGKLPSHNCSLKAAKPLVTETGETLYLVKRGKSSAFSTKKQKNQVLENPYRKRFRQGATIVPRAFYFVDFDQEPPPDFEDRVVSIKTAESIMADAKKPWKSISFQGQIESRFLFRTALAKNILPFALNEPELVVLPVNIENDESGRKVIKLHSAVELLRQGYLHANDWIRKGEHIWAVKRTAKNKKVSLQEYLNWQNKLTSQDLNIPYLVLYNSSAKDANATIVKRKDIDLEFFVESKAYSFTTENLNEAYYVSAFLNSGVPNLLMKDFQTRGLFGARDIHKRILDIYFPEYDERQEKHNRLAELGKMAHEKTVKFLKKNPPKEELTPMRLGRLRVEIKKNLEEEMEEIDKIVKELIGG